LRNAILEMPYFWEMPLKWLPKSSPFLVIPSMNASKKTDDRWIYLSDISGISAIFPIFRALRHRPEKVVDGVANAVKMHHTVSAQVLKKTRDV
jgi:hypothetical protein